MKFLRLTEQVDIEIGGSKISELSNEEKFKILQEAKAQGKKLSLKVRIEAIHETLTKNNIFYVGEKLKGDVAFLSEGKVRATGAYSWTRPYNKPMLINHDTDTKPLGRIIDAQYLDRTSVGTPGIEVIAEINDPEAIEMILDGRYYTVSIGADVDAVYCSICGANQMEEGCEHWKGETYEISGQQIKCYWKVGNIWFRELSFVNVPADEFARVIVIDGVKESVNSNEEESNEIFVIDESARTIKLLIESNDEVVINLNAKEAGNLDKDNEVNTEETVEQETEVKSSDTDNDTTTQEESTEVEEKNSTETVETLTEKVSNLESELSAVKESNQKVLESLLTILKDAGLIKENSDSASNSDDDCANSSEMQEKVNSLEAEVARLTEENNNLVEQNTNLHSEIRTGVIEKIVDLKIALGRVSEEKREDELTAYESRSMESLNDTLADFARELENSPKLTRETQSVTNPGLADNSQNGIIVDSKTGESDNSKPTLTNEDVFKNLLHGKIGL
jgi:hypothetical protein